MLGNTLQQHQVVHEDGGLELTARVASGAGGNYVNNSPQNLGGSKKKFLIAIIALIVAIIALITAGVSTIILIPKINDLSSSTNEDNDPNITEAGAIRSDTDSSITLSPTIYPSIMPSFSPLTEGETRTPSSTPTTAKPTTESPTESPNESNVEIKIENYYTSENKTTFYDCDCECPTNTYGVLNAGQLYKIGGYSGWEYLSSYPDLYPFADLHISIGDKILFKTKDYTNNDVWIVTEDVWNSCDWSDTTNLIQLADKGYVRGDCDDNPSYPCGYEFLVQQWHIENYGMIIMHVILFFSACFLIKRIVALFVLGNPLYFASSYRTSCADGVKIKVYVDNRTAIPVVTDSTDGFDISATDTIKDLQAAIGHLSRMLILSQFSTEQRVRSEGDSGLTNVRGHYDGDAAYDDGTYSNGETASIHDHSDNIILVGIGEIQAVLNGVEFRTRHNDYNLNMPHRNSTEYGATEPIPYPDVPPEVINAGDVDAQVIEMQEWFRAFKTQNKSHRNYPEYFKPILCYLEGTWILDKDELEEPFDSDRHQIDAKSWKQLHDKIRWMSNSGRKNSVENLAHLPSCIRNLVNDTYPIISNWEYRILCIPLKNDIPTSRFRIVDDLSVQLMGSPLTRDELYFDRRARFEINKYINLDNLNDHKWSPGRKKWNYLDYLMEQIPGKDNYIANITDELPDGSEQVIHFNTDKTVNSGYYTRYYGLKGSDAMGSSKHRRSWNDRYLFAAKTTQKKVSPIEFDFEMEDENGDTIYHKTISRWSYAIPLEIIYQTPLTKWNPYNIPFINTREYQYRTGSCDSISTAYNGWTTNNAYFTPASFFDGITQSSTADTAKENVCALDSNNEPKPVYGSGHWITFPEIANGVGKIRQRYPIFPIHNGGSASFKEVKALQAVVLPSDYDDPVANPEGFFGDSRDIIYGFELYLMGGGHQHICYIPGWRIRNAWLIDIDTDQWYTDKDHYVTIDCEERNSHSHQVRIWREYESDGITWKYNLRDCRYGTSSDLPNYPDDWDSVMDSDTGLAICSDNHGYFDR